MQIPPTGPLREPPGVTSPGAHRSAERANQAAGGRPAATPPVEALTEQGNGLNIVAQFIVDDATKRVMVRILDTQSGEVLRTIPPTGAAHLLPDTIKAVPETILDLLA